MKTIIHNGIPCVEARVHMLPSDVRMRNVKEPKGLVYSNNWLFKDTIPQHLYITSDDEIKDGDWYIPCNFSTNNENIIPLKWKSIGNPCNEKPFGKKIIATTDDKIQGMIKGLVGHSSNWETIEQKVASISQSFIKEYYKAGGIDKVLVELESWKHGELTAPFLLDGEMNSIKLPPSEVISDKIKTDCNNCIIIHPVEEKMYNKEGVLNKLTLNSLRNKFHSQSGMFINKQTSHEIIKWIEESL